jgi:hypothetical protein
MDDKPAVHGQDETTRQHYLNGEIRPKEDLYLQTKRLPEGRPPLFESQAAYLERYGLLINDEREALPADAFEPVRYVPD